MATAGESFLRKQHLDILNRLRRMGAEKMKLAQEKTAAVLPEKHAVIVKNILMKARPIREGVVPKEATGLASLTPVLQGRRYSTLKAVHEAGPVGFRSPSWSAALGEKKLASAFSARLESVLSDVGRRTKAGSLGPVPPTSSHSLGTARELGKIVPGQDATNPKLSVDESRMLLKAAFQSMIGMPFGRATAVGAGARTSFGKMIAKQPIGKPTNTGMIMRRSGPQAGSFSVRQPRLPGSVGGIA